MDFVRGFCHGVTAVFGAASNSDSARRFYRVFLGVTGTFWLSRLTGLFFFVFVSCLCYQRLGVRC